MAPRIYTANNFPFEQLELSKPKKNSDVKHDISYRYFQLKNHQGSIFFQTPKLPTPFGLKYNEPLDPNGRGNWSIVMNFPHICGKSYVEDGIVKALENCPDDELAFFKWANRLDNFVRDACAEKKRQQKLYKALIKVSEKRDEPGTFYSPQINFRVNSYQGVQLRALNMDTSQTSNSITLDDPYKSDITPMSSVIVVFKLGRVYMQSDKFGPHCFADRIKFWPSSQDDDLVFLDDNGELENFNKPMNVLKEDDFIAELEEN